MSALRQAAKCQCAEEIGKSLDGQCLNMDMFSGRAMIDLIRTDKFISENRRGKPKAVFASFCPFCGVKYEEAAPDDVTATTECGA